MTNAEDVEVPALGDILAGDLVSTLIAVLEKVQQSLDKANDTQFAVGEITQMMTQTLADVKIEVQKAIDASTVNDDLMNYLLSQLQSVADQGGFTITPWAGAKVAEADPLV